MREKIVSWISNRRAATSDVAPMDIGHAQHQRQQPIQQVEGDEWEEQEAEVAAVGKAGPKCYSCGGWGRVSRVCPSRFHAKGDRRESGKDGGKADGKGGRRVFG
eukprot:7047881-Lingulodinium_polyedra.AAC.1